MSTYLQSIELLREDLDGLPHLRERYGSLTQALDEQHAGKILDESKCLLESVFRTIAIDHRGINEQRRIYALNMPSLFEEVCQCITLSNDELVGSQLIEMAGANFEKIAQLRNANGASSHGRDGYHQSDLGMAEALYIAHTAVAITVMFYSRHKTHPDRHKNKRFLYEDHPEFNEWLDEQRDSIEIFGTVLLPSDVLFSTDLKAYRDALIEFLGNKDHDTGV